MHARRSTSWPDTRLMLLVIMATLALQVGCNSSAATAPSAQTIPTVVLDSKGPSQTTTAALAPPSGGRAKASGFIVPARQVQIASSSAGQIKAVYVAVGDVVTAGQRLASLDDSALQAQLAQAKAALASAQANYDLLAAGPTPEQLRQAEAALMGATANYSHTVAGARQAEIVSAQAALNAANEQFRKVQAGPQDEAIAAASATLRSTEAALRQAQTRYDDAYRRDPAGIGASPAALALEQATNAYNGAKATYDLAAKPADSAQLAEAAQQVEAARATLDRARRPATAYDIDQAKAQVQAAQAALDALKAGARAQQLDAARAQVTAAQAQVQSTQALLSVTEVHAPMAGTIGKVNIHSAEWALAGQTILVLADLDHLRVETTDLSERDLPAISLGQPVSVFVKALNQTISGHVIEIAPLADSIGGDVVYKTSIDLGEHPANLRAGMSVEVQFGP